MAGTFARTSCGVGPVGVDWGREFGLMPAAGPAHALPSRPDRQRPGHGDLRGVAAIDGGRPAGAAGFEHRHAQDTDTG